MRATDLNNRPTFRNPPNFLYRANKIGHMLSDMICLHIINRVIFKWPGENIQIVLNVNVRMLKNIHPEQAFTFICSAS